MSTGGDDLELDYAALVDMIADVVYAIDLRGCFIYVNTAGEDVFGWRAQDLMGEHMTAVLAPDSVAATVEHFRRGVMDPARTPYFETTILRPDGTTRELEIHAGALYRDGRQVARQGVGRDITELKRLQSELANKTARLAMVEEQQRAAMELYRKFSLVATHMSRDPQASSGALDAVDELGDERGVGRELRGRRGEGARRAEGPLQAGAGTLLAFATAPGQVALDAAMIGTAFFGGASARMRRVASMPSISGICISIRTMS